MISALWQRLAFPLITVFFVTMNVLLWRTEYRGGREAGSAVPIETVWRKILTTPDDSNLEVSRAGALVGFIHWNASAGGVESSEKSVAEGLRPEGMLESLKGYTADLDGNFLLSAPNNRLRLTLHLDLTTNGVVQRITAKLNIRPYNLEINASESAQKLQVKYQSDADNWDRTFAYDELRHPQQLLRDLGLPPLMAALPALAQSTNAPAANIGLKWEASNSWIKMGHSQVRVYRIQARLLDNYQIVIVVSRVGEILRVELPGGLVMMNNHLGQL